MADSKSSYREDGYLLRKGFFRAEEIDAIRSEAQSIFVAQMQRLGLVSESNLRQQDIEEGMYRFFEADLQSFTNCGKQAQHLISLHRLSLDDRIVRELKETLGLRFPNISTRPVLYFNSRRLAKKEVYWRLSLHQDWRSMQGSLDAVVVWLPLVAVDRSLGALEVFPGSHRIGLVKADMEDGYGKAGELPDLGPPVPLEVDVGDAVFFSSFLLHQSGTNVTNSIRWSCHFRYNNLQEPTFIDRGFPHPYIYRPQEDLITKDFPSQAQIFRTFGQ